MATRGHFYKSFMTFFFDQSFLQAMEFISMKFDKKIGCNFNAPIKKRSSSKRKTVQPVIKIINYGFSMCNSRFSFYYYTNFKCFIT